MDKVYYESTSDYRVSAPTIIDIFNRSRTDVPEIMPLMAKDSMNMDDADREALVRYITESDYARFLVTHGTDTLSDSAQAMTKALADAGIAKTVVFTGSFLPTRFRNTDAEYNVGFAYACAQILPAGCYVAIQGQVFLGDAVMKNRQEMRFESTQ